MRRRRGAVACTPLHEAHSGRLQRPSLIASCSNDAVVVLLVGNPPPPAAAPASGIGKHSSSQEGTTCISFSAEGGRMERGRRSGCRDGGGSDDDDDVFSSPLFLLSSLLPIMLEFICIHPSAPNKPWGRIIWLCGMRFHCYAEGHLRGEYYTPSPALLSYAAPGQYDTARQTTAQHSACGSGTDKRQKKDNGITHRNIITNGVQSKINKQHSQKKRGGTRGKRVPKRNR